MAASSINGVALSGLSAINGVSSISAINGTTASLGGGGTCTEVIPLLSFGGTSETAMSTMAQKIKNASGMVVCEVTIVLKGSGNATCGLWSNPDGTGTQYGTTSEASALAGSYGGIVFTWLVNPTVPAATDFYIVASGTIDGFQIGTGDEYENGNGYDAYANGSIISGSDARFALSIIV